VCLGWCCRLSLIVRPDMVVVVLILDLFVRKCIKWIEKKRGSMGED
jgi:hypothetical protein